MKELGVEADGNRPAAVERVQPRLVHEQDRFLGRDVAADARDRQRGLVMAIAAIGGGLGALATIAWRRVHGPLPADGSTPGPHKLL